jgi:rhodanese-related sulfurtransferase
LTTFNEIGELRARAWRLVTSPLADMAKDDILRRDHAHARRALAVLDAANLPPSLADEYEQEILGPCEDEFEALLAVAFSGYRYEVKRDQNVAERRAMCRRAQAKFDETVRPALKQILELAGAQSATARRAFATAADALDELAEGFETGFDDESRLKTLRRAWQLAPPESASLLLIEEHLAAAGDACERPPKTEDDYARQLRLALREPAAQPELFTAYVRKEEAEKRLELWGKGASRFVFLVVLALFVGKCFNSLPGSRRTGIDGAMNLNIAVPRFTPLPMRELYSDLLVGSVSASELQTKLKAKSVTLLHVGAKGEYETGHIPGALWMPEEEVPSRARRLPKNRPIVVYCFCGELEASRRAAGKLRIHGFTSVSVLKGGYRAWLDAGLPVETVRRRLVRNGDAN